tara:strand:+ start:18389 stop:18946 length:558 start_codon:yes stop_codon:yes gene_type:complete
MTSQIAYQLTRPISYLLLHHPAGKIYNWRIPSVLTLISTVLLFLCFDVATVAAKDGLIDQLAGFITGLPGFLIAALAAIATFNRPVIDEEMIDSPTITIIVGNTRIDNSKLTRRDFLLRLFAYLTVLSIFLVVLVKVAMVVTLPATIALYGQWFFVIGFLLLFWQLLVLLLFGMYYLCERLNMNM